MIIRGFSEVGVLWGEQATSITLECREFSNASTGKKAKGLTVQVKETSPMTRDNTSYIDYDEIPSILSGIDYIGKSDKSVTRLDNFQADYRTRGDLEISTFSTDRGILVAVSSGTIGAVTAYFPREDLIKIRRLIEDGKARLDSISDQAQK